jgi:hypothetical protein
MDELYNQYPWCNFLTIITIILLGYLGFLSVSFGNKLFHNDPSLHVAKEQDIVMNMLG